MRLYPQYTSWDNTKDPERPLVIGYVSPDYFTHSVSYFIEAPLVYHDYQNYKVVVYSAVVKVLITFAYLPAILCVHVYSSLSCIFMTFHFLLRVSRKCFPLLLFLKTSVRKPILIMVDSQ